MVRKQNKLKLFSSKQKINNAVRYWQEFHSVLTNDKPMKIAYISHPISGNLNDNLKSIARIVRFINLNEPETVPFVPYYADIIVLDDNNPEERNRGIKNGITLLKSGVVDELRIYGPRISHGMMNEIEIAIATGIPIIATSATLQKELTAILP